MRTPTLYPQIEKDLKTISRVLHADDDMLLEEKWREVKRHIEELAGYCKMIEAERKRRDAEPLNP